MEDDWDLLSVLGSFTTDSAVSCTTTTTTTSTATPAFAASAANLSFVTQQNCDVLGVPDLPPPPPPPPPPFSPLSGIEGLNDTTSQQMQQHVNQTESRTRRTKASNSLDSRPKKSKKEMQRVVEMAAEALSTDTWSWKKYGQKPIKGLQYPRGYYKCRTSNECLARKKVDRKTSDPEMFIVTYTGEHNHPMPLPTPKKSPSGRNKRIKQKTFGEPRISNPSCSSLPVLHSDSVDVSSAPEQDEKKTEEGNKHDTVEQDMVDVMNVPCEMKLEDEFFEGLGELEDVSGVVSNSVQVPWLTDDIISTVYQGEDFDFSGIYSPESSPGENGTKF